MALASSVNDYVMVDADNELTLKGTKTLTGRELVAGEFSFGLYDESGKLLETVTNDAAGNFAFTKLTYKVAENENTTYTYTVKEIAGTNPSVTYDKTVYTVVVNVKDNNKGGAELTYTVNGTDKGAIAFTNVYTKPADVAAKILIQKNVVNKTTPGIGLKDFTFILSDGSSTVETKSDEKGKAGFQITFSADDIGKTYEYKVSEKKGSTAGMTYDKTVHTITVQVGQNADGTLSLLVNNKATDSVEVSFTNTYEKPDTPVTGDSFPVMLLGALMLLSAAGMATILLSKRRNRGKYAA
jgi:pilin isopeptide linkage protein